MHLVFTLSQGQAVENIPRVLKEYDASHLVCDFSPLRIARRWKDDILQLTEATIYEGKIGIPRIPLLGSRLVDAMNTS